MAFVLVAVAFSVAAAWGALRYYLSTGGARELVAAKLETALGTDVQVGELDVGWNSSAVQLRVFEAASEGEPPRTLLTVKAAHVDVSIPQLIRGTTPDQFTLDGAHLHLRLDRDGQVLTRLPKSQGSSEMPSITLHDAAVTVAQEGRSDFRLEGIQCALRSQNGAITLEGEIHDGRWGDWTSEIKWNLSAGIGSAVLRSTKVRFTPATLETLPFVPAVVWQQLRPEGLTAAELRIVRESPDGPVRTRIELNPQRADVALSSLDLQVADLTGRILIDDAVVELQGVHGSSAGGDLNVDGRLDFATSPSLLKFQVSAQRLNLRQLPESWSLPPQLEGRLKGHANIELTIEDGKVETRGDGRGEVEDARLGGIPAEKVELRLRSDGRRFRFSNSAAGGAFVPPLASAIALATVLQPPNPAPSPALDLNFSFKEAELGEIVQKLKLNLPFRVGGRVTVGVRARLPLDRVSDLKAYQLAGRISSSTLRLDDLELVDIDAQLNYRDGILSLENLTGKLQGDDSGRIEGGARAELVPQNDLNAQLALKQVQLGAILQAIGGDVKKGRGPISGKIDFRAPLARLTDPASWTATAELDADRLTLYGRTLSSVRAIVRAENASARLAEAKLRGEGIDVSGTGLIDLKAPYAFSAAVQAKPGDATDFGKLLNEFQLPIAITGEFEGSGALRGSLKPWTIQASGRAGASSLHLDRSRIERLEFAWELQPNRFRVSELSAVVYDGAVTGSADLPIDAATSGTTDLRFERINSAPLIRDWARLPVGIVGRMSGSMKASLAAAGAGQPRRLTADLDLESPRLVVAGVPTTRMQAKARYRPEAIEYDLTGNPLGGRLRINGSAPLVAGVAGSGRVQLERLDLSNWPAKEGESWRGMLDLNLAYRDQNGSMTGQGRIDVMDLGVGDDVLSERLGADLRIEGPVVFIAGPTGSLAGGQLRGRARYDLSGRKRGFISLNAYGMEAARLFAPIPSLSRQVRATVDGQLRGSLGREWTGSGNLTFARGRLFGLSLTNGRLPFEWAMAPGIRGELKIRDLTAQGGNGRINGTTEYAWGLENRLDGRLRFSGIDLRAVLLETASFGKIGAGRADGRFDFRGENLRDFDDLTGTLALGFSQTSALDLPVLRPLAPYLATGQSLTGFHRGDLLANLSRGVFRIQRLALEAPSSRLFAEGSVTTEGRLDLQVTAMTGQIGANPDLVGLAGLRLPTIGPIPVSMLVRISNSLSNRVVRLRVGGTLGSPTIQVNAAALLSEGVVRYLLSSTVPLP